jgi:hypothetical protein
MENNNIKKYLWVLEWDNPFVSENNKGVLFYSIEPKDSMMACALVW